MSEKEFKPFGPESVCYGMCINELGDIPSNGMKRLTRMIAKVSESSYRRGLQHGAMTELCIDPTELRFNKSLNVSIAAIGGPSYDVVDMLLTQYPVLMQVGLRK